MWLKPSVCGGLAALAVACLANAAPADAKRSEARGKAEPARAALTPEAINGASFAPQSDEKSAKKRGKAAAGRADPLLIKAQVLLDRARFSPGAIDGRDGDNLRGALEAFAAAQGLPATTRLTPELFEKLQATSPDPVVTEYTITEADAAGPFTDKIPPKLEQQADLDSLGYTDAREMLAERFHMQRDLLSALNPGKALDRAGTVITVAAVPALETGKAKDGAKDGAKNGPKATKVTRVEVDKAARRVRAYGENDALVGSFPASVGSEEKPAPTGTFKVTGVAFEPTYTYNPEYRFKGVEARTKFSIKAGPNNPVGLVWIDISKPSYGIHGTPDPEKVGKTESHGCVRLTNWDVRDLANHVQRGAKVEFKE